ncbi:MAG: fibronectin-binding domain-containing protein [Candidatus Lokiarchaeota archaeon]|nr:fibronectin-binding domain-containing protein [Candidatus Lokiarchaeota archaeon]
MFKTVLSNFTIHALVSEISSKIINGWIQQIYQLQENQIFIFRIRTKSSGTLSLLAQPGIRIHLTSYEREKPKIPTKFCMNVLRKNLKNLRVLDFYQFNFDRICVLELGRINWEEEKEIRETQFKIVFEFFKYGTLTVLNNKDIVSSSLQYKQMRDRRVIPNRPYDFAPSRGYNFLKITNEDLKKIFQDNEKEIIHILLSNLNIGPVYSEEICLRSGIKDMKRMGSSLTNEEINNIFENIQILRNLIIENEYSPQVIKKDGEFIDITPIKLVYYNKSEYEIIDKQPPTNDVVDEFYSSREKTIEHKEILETQGEKHTKFTKTQKIIDEQRKKIQDMKESIEKYRKYGDLIYQYFTLIEELLKTINDARQSNIEWDEIINKIEEGKGKEIPAAQIVKKIIPNEALLQLNLNDETVSVDFRYSASELAEKFYRKSKKAKSKLKGAENALIETQKKLDKVKIEVEEAQKLKSETIKKKRKKKWYETFHWTRSSDDFLIIGGKDAKTNEILIKKHKEKDDIFVHAVFHGASSVIIKTGGKPVPERTLHEAAGVSISYSSAWKSNFSSADAYWVTSDQVSFTPPTGEYLEKGSFIIRGKKEPLNDIALEIKIGFIYEKEHAIPVMGIGDSLINKAKFIVTIRPGELKSSDISKQIKKYWLEKIKEKNDESANLKVKNIKIEEIQQLIPSGKAQIFFDK